MVFCSNCGNNIGNLKFCSECGEINKVKYSKTNSQQNLKTESNNKSDLTFENIKVEYFESREIDNYINHLKYLIKSKNSVLNQDDLFLYEKTLRSLPEDRFKKLNFPKFVLLNKVIDINRYLGIEENITNKQLGRSYEGGKLPDKLKVSNIKSEKKPWYKKWWGILITLLLIGVLLRVIFPDPSSSSSNNQIDNMKKESSLPDGVSSACFCMDALSGGSIYGSTYEQKSKCRKMFICWDNAQADCLMGTSQIWYECID